MSSWRTPIYRELGRRLVDVLGAKTADGFEKLGLVTVDDLVRHVPRRYISGTGMSDFATLKVGEEVAVVAEVQAVKTFGTIPSARVQAVLSDGHGRLSITLFARHERHLKWWAGLLQPGSRGIFIGRVGSFNGEL